MPVSYTIAALFPPVCDFRFTEVTDPTTPNYAVGGVPQFDQLPLSDMTQEWQTALPYYQKKTFADKCTVMVLTNRVAAGATYPSLILEAPDAGISVPLSLPGGTFINGAQRITGLTIPYVNPDTFGGTATDIPADIFQWQFYMNEILDPATDSGVVYLRMRVYGDDALTVYREYLSEPIMVYDTFPGTVLIEGKNTSTRLNQGIVATGWNDGKAPTFQLRVEGMPLQYKPAGIAVTYLQQLYLNRQLNAQNFRTFTFRVGAVSAGVPAYILEKISELFITDLWKINNKYFIQNIDENGGVSNFWKVEDSETANLVVAEIPIRERYMGQNALVVATPMPDLELYTSPGFPYAVCPWTLATGEVSVPFTHVIIENLAGETAQIAAWNVTLASGGAAGTIVRTAGVLNYVPSGDTPFLPVPIRLLTAIMKMTFYRDPLGGGAGYITAGYNSAYITDWGDGSSSSYDINATFGALLTTHTYPAMAGSVWISRVFHDDFIKFLNFTENGAYPYNCALIDIQADIPTSLNILSFYNCDSLDLSSCIIDLTLLPSLVELTIRVCDLVTTFNSYIFTVPSATLSFVGVQGNPLTSAGVDDFFIEFVANTWDGVTPMYIDIRCIPAQPPTAASATERGLLLTAGSTLLTD